jgi:hypothetical protein
MLRLTQFPVHFRLDGRAFHSEKRAQNRVITLADPSVVGEVAH